MSWKVKTLLLCLPVFTSLMFGLLYARTLQLQYAISQVESHPPVVTVVAQAVCPQPVCNTADISKQLGAVQTDLLNIQVAQLKANPTPTSKEPFTWIKLGDTWTLTWYGSMEDGFLGKKHGAAWNGLTCKDWAALSTDMPDVVTESHFGAAMPGVEFYCMPIKVCVADKCVVTTAVDVPHNDVVGGKPHVDVWRVVAEQLGIEEVGIADATVYVGVEAD